MVFPFSKNVSGEKDTAVVARTLAESVAPGTVITLKGNLGAGKTFFVKNFCGYFGINEVSSPTFSIVNEYDACELVIYHFDFYRIVRPVELYDIGIEEYLSDPDAIILIEWPEQAPEVLPGRRIDIEIVTHGEKERTISIVKNEN